MICEMGTTDQNVKMYKKGGCKVDSIDDGFGASLHEKRESERDVKSITRDHQAGKQT